MTIALGKLTFWTVMSLIWEFAAFLSFPCFRFDAMSPFWMGNVGSLLSVIMHAAVVLWLSWFSFPLQKLGVSSSFGITVLSIWMCAEGWGTKEFDVESSSVDDNEKDSFSDTVAPMNFKQEL